MKSIRKAFLRNQRYHHNLLGKEFNELVEEATEKLLPRPNEEANRNVILAINDPNTGMELSPQRISQELRKQLRSNTPKKQLLATVLIGDVLRECRPHIQSVVVELLEAVNVLASTDTTTSGQALRDAKEVALKILKEHGRRLAPNLKTVSPPLTPPTPRTTQQTVIVQAMTEEREPRRSLLCIKQHAKNCKNHCEVVRSMLLNADMTSDLVEELVREIQHMRTLLTTSIERLTNYTGSHIESATAKAFGAIDIADQVLQLQEKILSGEITELTFKDLPSIERPISELIEAEGWNINGDRCTTMDRFGLDALEDGLRQTHSATSSTQPDTPATHVTSIIDTIDRVCI